MIQELIGSAGKWQTSLTLILPRAASSAHATRYGNIYGPHLHFVKCVGLTPFFTYRKDTQ